MTGVSIRELRNHGGEVVDRVARGEYITITRNGRPVAELRPLGRRPSSRESLMARRRSLPDVDPAAMRRQLDEVLDSSL
jgi:prevent-host-death family protein